MATRCKTGSIPSGLPSFARPRLTGSQALSLIGPASGIVLVRFSDSILTTRSFAARRNEAVDADQQLLAFSVAGVAADSPRGMPIGTSGSRTTVNDAITATSQVSGLARVTTIAVLLLFLTAPIRYLPSAVLGAVIVFASLVEAVGEVRDGLRRRIIKIARATQTLRDQLDGTGLTALIRAEHVHATVTAAVEGCAARLES